MLMGLPEGDESFRECGFFPMLSASRKIIVAVARVLSLFKIYPLKLSLDQEIFEEEAAEVVAADAVESTRAGTLLMEMSRSPLRWRARFRQFLLGRCLRWLCQVGMRFWLIFRGRCVSVLSVLWWGIR